MGKVLDTLRRVNTRTAMVVAIVAAAIVVPATLYAWGPDRATFTEQNPAPYVTFNSITNNTNYGDERDFVMIKEATAANSTWSSTATAQEGKEYTVRMYVHNNAADHLNLVAENVRASASIQQGTAKSIGVSGFINASNSNPGQVWDDANLTSDKDFNVNYVPGSAYYRNNIFTNGTALPDSIMTSGGALLGYDKLDGKIPGCYKYSGYVYFKIKPQFGANPDFKTTKYVSQHGKDEWKKDYQAQPGETVDYLLNYKNTGDTQQDNVMIKDTLPTGMSYIPGSSILGNSLNPNGVKTNDNVTTTGANVGSYAPNGNAWIIFSAKVPSKEQLECGNNVLKNTVRTTASDYYKEDAANVNVNKECQPEAAYKCTALAVNKLSDTKFKFETGYTVTGGTFKSVSYTVRNEAGATVATVNGTPNAAEYTQATPGKYSVQATVTFTVNGQDVTATSEACKKAFEVPAPEDKKIIVCEIATKKIVTIKESEFDASKYSKDLNDCKEVPSDIIVCDLTTKEVVTIKESEFDSSKYSKDLKDCAEAPKENCPIPGKEHMPKDSPDCKVTPVTPTELPQTGSNDGVLTIAGLATLALVLGYAVTARRTIG